MNDLIKLTKNKEIIYASFILKGNGLEPVGTPDFEQWIECGKFINRARGAVHFWIGDWLNYGERQWGEKYLEAIKTTGYQYQTLADDKWVAARVHFSRRRENLSFDHHKTIASLDSEEQELLLQEAIEKKLNNKDFRKYVEQRELRNEPQKVNQDESSAASIIRMNNLFLEHLEQLNLEKYTFEEKNYIFIQLRKTAEKIMQFLNQHEND